MKQPRVSILMAVHNAARFLSAAIESVQRQTLSDWQLICVDDASTDASLHILQSYAEQDDRILVLQLNENQGQAVARNFGLTQAQGEYITMLDADDWLSDDAIERVVEVFDAHPTTDAVLFRLCQHEEKDGTERYTHEPLPLDTVLTGEQAMRLSLTWQIHGYYVVRAEIHHRFPYDDSYRLYSDDNTTHVHFLHAREVRFCQGVYYWRQHTESTTHHLSMNYFLHIRANQSMLQTLKREGVADDVIAEYEVYRWRIFDGQYYVFFHHRHDFTAEQRRFLQREFSDVYATLRGHGSFPLYCLRKRLRFRLGSVRRWLNRRFKSESLT